MHGLFDKNSKVSARPRLLVLPVARGSWLAMISIPSGWWLARRGHTYRLGGLLCACLIAAPAWADPSLPPEAFAASTQTDTLPPRLALPAAVQWALGHNPTLTALRQQHGIAAAGVVIARTYPFNPVWEGKVRAAEGPASAGITNRVANEHLILIDVEVHGQGKYRRQGASAALSRTDWEIADHELDFAIRVVRAFNSVLYRQAKLRLIDDAVHLNQQAADHLRLRVEAGQVKFRPDLIVIQTEIDAARAQYGPARIALETAWYDLRRNLGVVHENFDLAGELEIAPPPMEPSVLLSAALIRRPDLHARQAAVAEAEARLRLEIANRHGNPNVGPAYEYDSARINLIGAQFIVPLPVFNNHRGEILQREAERTRAALELRQTEVLVEQDLQAALAKLREATAALETYRTLVLPNLRSSLEALERLFSQNDPNVDVLRILEVRRNLLKARDGYLDAAAQLGEARADLAAAVADPFLEPAACPMVDGVEVTAPPPGACLLGVTPGRAPTVPTTAPGTQKEAVLELPPIQVAPATQTPNSPPLPPAKS